MPADVQSICILTMLVIGHDCLKCGGIQRLAALQKLLESSIANTRRLEDRPSPQWCGRPAGVSGLRIHLNVPHIPGEECVAMKNHILSGSRPPNFHLRV
jgi:hypothetical protein